MKSDLLRLTVAALLAMGLAAGCSTTEEVETPTETTPSETSKSSAEIAAEQAIADAKAANKEAKALGYEWRDTGKIIKEAEDALADGGYERAKAKADKAKAQADAAINQYYLEQAKMMADGKSSTELDASLEAGDGLKAYEIATKLAAAEASERMAYTVMKGDSLWAIAAMENVYANAYYWPLIYKANSDSIEDADLIFPGQELSIVKTPSALDINQAVTHAKSRGAWSVGAVEESDKDYLAQ